MSFVSAPSVIVEVGVAVPPPITPVRAAFVIGPSVALATFEVFPMRMTALVAEFLESVGRRAQSV